MKASNDSNYFAKLNAINVSEQVEKKGAFAYLSWPYAVAQLRLADPGASWEVRRFEGLPYLSTDAGVFVEVAVSVQGVTLSQIHPVLDGKNRPILAPTAFDINTSIQRCLVKAIALHGLGLYIYAGEDLPQTAPAEPEAEKPASPVDLTPTPIRAEGVTINASQQAQIKRLISEVGGDLPRLLSYFGVAALEEIKSADYQRVIRSLEKRRAA